MRRVFGEVAMTLGAMTILLVVLAASNDRVREQLSARAITRPGQVAGMTTRARSVAGTAGAIARAEIRAHTPMVVFTLAGAILVVFMLRT